MKKEIRVEIVAPVHNRCQITLQCLKSLERINTEKIKAHIIIVDDGSTDGTAEAIKKEFPKVEVIEGDGNLWYTEGTNVGIRSALKHRPDYILTINDDTVFDADFLGHLVETAVKHPKSIVGPLLLLWDQPHKLFQIAPVFEIRSGGWRHWHRQTVWTIPHKPFKVDLIVGNCVLFPVEAFEKHGLLNSRRYPNFGDAEITPRFRQKGWDLLIEPRARVFCQPNTLPAKIGSLSLSGKINALIVDLKHVHNLRRRFYASWDGAPNRLTGVAAFFVFLVRIIFRRNVEKPDWNESRQEQPLTETLAGAVVND